MASIGGQSFTGGVSVYDASITMTQCLFDRIQADDGINTVRSNTRLIQCRFIESKDDAIDYDFSGGEIIDCYIYRSGGDAIDCGTAGPKISGNYIYASVDKGISIGEASSPVVEHNFIIGGHYGIAVKDDSSPLIRHNTIAENQRGLSFYIKKPKEFGCPTARVDKCIIWGNTVEIDNLCGSDYTLSRSVVRDGADGDRIFTEPPEFDEVSSKSGLKYITKTGSDYAIKGYGAYRGIW
jgi:parallel beta-helix repeat protein